MLRPVAKLRIALRMAVAYIDHRYTETADAVKELSDILRRPRGAGRAQRRVFQKVPLLVHDQERRFFAVSFLLFTDVQQLRAQDSLQRRIVLPR